MAIRPGLRSALLVCALVTLPVACKAPRAAREGGAPDAEAVVRRQAMAWNRGDIDAFVSEGYWNSPELTFFSGGDVTQGYDGLLERYRQRYVEGDNEMGQLTFSDIESLSLGSSAAMVRGRWDLAFSDGETVGGLFTLLMRPGKKGWVVVHDHTSVDGPADEGEDGGDE